MEQKLLNLVNDKVNFFKAFSEKVTEFSEGAKQSKDGSQEGINKKIDSVLYNIETSYLFNELLVIIMFLKELSVELTPEAKEFFNTYSNTIYKRKFTLESGELVETTKGLLETEREKLLNSQFLESIKNNLK